MDPDAIRHLVKMIYHYLLLSHAVFVCCRIFVFPVAILDLSEILLVTSEG